MADAFLATLQAALDGEYIVERELTAGGQSRLFLARDVDLPRQVVIKLLPPELAGEVALKRFKREIAVLVKLQHPHIVPIIGMGATDAMMWYVMPFISGASLEERLRGGALAPSEGLEILYEVSDALAHAHGIGVVHRDLKPGNVQPRQSDPILKAFLLCLKRDQRCFLRPKLVRTIRQHILQTENFTRMIIFTLCTRLLDLFFRLNITRPKIIDPCLQPISRLFKLILLRR